MRTYRRNTVHMYGCSTHTFYWIYRTWLLYCIRAVAPTPAGPAMAGPVFASGAKILKTEVMHFKHTFSLGGGATKGNTMF